MLRILSTEVVVESLEISITGLPVRNLNLATMIRKPYYLLYTQIMVILSSLTETQIKATPNNTTSLDVGYSIDIQQLGSFLWYSVYKSYTQK